MIENCFSFIIFSYLENKNMYSLRCVFIKYSIHIKILIIHKRETSASKLSKIKIKNVTPKIIIENEKQ